MELASPINSAGQEEEEQQQQEQQEQHQQEQHQQQEQQERRRRQSMDLASPINGAGPLHLAKPTSTLQEKSSSEANQAKRAREATSQAAAADDCEVVAVLTIADREVIQRAAATQLQDELTVAAKRPRNSVANRQPPPTAAANVRIKHELNAAGKRELRKLETWYCDRRVELLRPGEPAYAPGVEVERLPRIDKYPWISAKLVAVASDRAAKVRLRKLLLLRQLKAWEQFGVGRDGYAAPLTEGGEELEAGDHVIDLVDSDDETSVAAATVGCTAIEIDNYAEQHWDVLFAGARVMKAEDGASLSAVLSAAAIEMPPACVKSETTVVPAEAEAKTVELLAACRICTLYPGPDHEGFDNNFSTFEPLGNGLLATSSSDGRVQGWDAATGSELWCYDPGVTEFTGSCEKNMYGQGPTVAGARCMLRLSHGLLACWGEAMEPPWHIGLVRVFESATGAEVCEVEFENAGWDSPLLVIGLQCGLWVASGTDEDAGDGWSVCVQRGGLRLHDLGHDEQLVSMVALEGSLFATSCTDGSVRVWDAAEGTLVHT